MASEYQIAANRFNARTSKGPKTAEGKALSSGNAMTHGLSAARGLLAGERPEEFFEMRAGLFDELAPESPVESELADRIVSIFWRLRRIPAFEVAILVWVHARERSQSSYTLGNPLLAGRSHRSPGE